MRRRGRPSRGLIIRPDRWKSLTQITPLLGEGPETLYDQTGYELQPGETLALFSDGALESSGSEDKPLGEVGMGKFLQAMHDCPAAEMAAVLRRHLDQHANAALARDRTVLLVKRRLPA